MASQQTELRTIMNRDWVTLLLTASDGSLTFLHTIIHNRKVVPSGNNAMMARKAYYSTEKNYGFEH